MNPYESLPDKAFWKTAVGSRSMFDIEQLWQPKFKLRPSDKIATYGSCFAQHIGKALRKRGFNWLITEPKPPNLTAEQSSLFNYDVFSSRTANIYTTSLLLQWVKWAQGEEVPNIFWEQNNRFIDPFRPKIEPDGFENLDELQRLREVTINAFRHSVEQANCFVFTLGLTESWADKNGFEYPMCPGTVAGDFDENQHLFENQNFNQVKSNLEEALNRMRKMNSKLKFILTVSPVPLTATNSGQHVLVATMRSKSILRSVAASLSESADYIDYFPSYEIINSTPFKGAFFEPNMRSVNPHGVEFVMSHFFCNFEDAINSSKEKANTSKPKVKRSDANRQDEHCEEALLDAFKK